MKKIPQDFFNTLITDAKILEEDGFGPKVYLNNDGVIVKLFRHKKKLFSSSIFQTPAKRFYKNSIKLNDMGIAAIRVEQIGDLPFLGKEAVIYQSLPGETLRTLLKDSNESRKKDLLGRFADYLNELHNQGVYFRSIHFGNVLIQPDGSFALIDIADMKIRNKALPLSMRLRNFKAFLRYEEDCQSLEVFGFKSFIERYLAKSSIEEKSFYKHLATNKKHPLHSYLA